MSTEDRLAALEAKVQHLADQKAIFDCIKRNSRGNDRFDVGMIVSSYRADGLHDFGNRQVFGSAYSYVDLKRWGPKWRLIVVS